MSPWDARELAKLKGLSQAESDASVAMRRQVLKLRQAGVPWQAIADAIGVAKQSAHRRFRHLEETES